ncbi:MAG: DsbA family protein [Patescibacteria group bacterium]
MFQAQRPWYKRGLTIVGLILAVIVLSGLGLFIWQTNAYYQQMKKGYGGAEFMPISQSGDTNLTSFQDSERQRIKKLVAGQQGDPFAGPADAKSEIVEFVDYGCMYCAMSVGAIKDLIKLRPDIKITLRDYPVVSLHPNARNASMAARCVWNQGNEEIFWKYHDLLYGQQDKHDPISLRQFVRTAGGDVITYDRCMKNEEPAGLIGQSIMDADQAGVYGTPTFFVDGVKLQGAHDMESLIKFLNN